MRAGMGRGPTVPAAGCWGPQGGGRLHGFLSPSPPGFDALLLLCCVPWGFIHQAPFRVVRAEKPGVRVPRCTAWLPRSVPTPPFLRLPSAWRAGGFFPQTISICSES